MRPLEPGIEWNRLKIEGVDWVNVAKVALAVYLAVSVGYVVVVSRRRVKNRRAGSPVRPDPNPFYTRRWEVAPTPLPEWAYLDEDEIKGASAGDVEHSGHPLPGASLGQGDDRIVELGSDTAPFLPRRRRR